MRKIVWSQSFCLNRYRYRNKTALKYSQTLPNVFITDNEKQLRSWINAVFNDESAYQLGVAKKVCLVWQKNITSDMCWRDKMYSPKVMVWGAVGINFKSKLVIFNCSVNSDSKYWRNIYKLWFHSKRWLYELVINVLAD